MDRSRSIANGIALKTSHLLRLIGLRQDLQQQRILRISRLNSLQVGLRDERGKLTIGVRRTD